MIVGTGATGLSVARYFLHTGQSFTLTDTRSSPPGLVQISQIPEIFSAWAGPLSAIHVGDFDRIIVSPGIPISLPDFTPAREAGIEILGDIELLARESQRPVIGITGSNGKSTVTAMVSALLRGLGVSCATGGNFGTPALDLLSTATDILILELSSFQLELTSTLHLQSAAILNLSPDHLDRYSSMTTYLSAKERIFNSAERRIVNRSDPFLRSLVKSTSTVTFGVNAPQREEDFGLFRTTEGIWLVRGEEKLLQTKHLALQGPHDVLNTLAAIALIWPWIGDGHSILQEVMKEFTGLPHRCQPVLTHAGVQYFDDSKGTNVGATITAIQSFSQPVVLIAGGQGKGQDFRPLSDAFAGHVRYAVLLGEDAASMASVIAKTTPYVLVNSMKEAVQRAASMAEPGDVVLLSPACASLDMFINYADRGRQFVKSVRELAGSWQEVGHDS